MASECRQRALVREVTGENLSAEMVPFAFPGERGQAEIRELPFVFVLLRHSTRFRSVWDECLHNLPQCQSIPMVCSNGCLWSTQACALPGLLPFALCSLPPHTRQCLSRAWTAAMGTAGALQKFLIFEIRATYWKK